MERKEAVAVVELGGAAHAVVYADGSTRPYMEVTNEQSDLCRALTETGWSSGHRFGGPGECYWISGLYPPEQGRYALSFHCGHKAPGVEHAKCCQCGRLDSPFLRAVWEAAHDVA